MPDERKGGSVSHGSHEVSGDCRPTALLGATKAFSKPTKIARSQASSKNNALVAAIAVGTEPPYRSAAQESSPVIGTVKDKVERFSSPAARSMESIKPRPASPSIPRASTQGSWQEYPHIAAKLAANRSIIQPSSNIPEDTSHTFTNQPSSTLTSRSSTNKREFPPDNTIPLLPLRQSAEGLSSTSQAARQKSTVVGVQNILSAMDKNIQVERPQPPSRKRDVPPLPPRSSTLAGPVSLSEPNISRQLHPYHPEMSERSLAHAIAASSLASSRSPSPSKRSSKPPPPPPRRRRSRSRSFLSPSRSSKSNSRTPSPKKGLRSSLRDPEKANDAQQRPPKRVTFNALPNGSGHVSNGVWRDQITERERKRYEGVWAANRGVARFGLMDDPEFRQALLKKSSSPEDLVLNLVVEDIWSRSRLPRTQLEKIWNLVSRDATGMLSREEFVVGMWFIDQCLKGRKLPMQVSAGLWESVRYIPMPRRRG